MSIPRAPKPTFVPNPTTRLCPVCAPTPVFRPPSRPRPAHFRAQPHDPALPRLRTFARIPTHEPPQACALSCPTPRSGFAPSAHLRPYPDLPAAPGLRTFAPNPTIRLCPVCAPSPAFRPTSRATPAHFRAQPTIRLCPVCVPSPVFRPTSRPRPAHFRAQPHDPALPRLRTFDRIPTHEPPYVSAPSFVFLRMSRPASAHQRRHSPARAAPRLRSFTRIPTHELLRVCAPLPTTLPPRSLSELIRVYQNLSEVSRVPPINSDWFR